MGQLWHAFPRIEALWEVRYHVLFFFWGVTSTAVHQDFSSFRVFRSVCLHSTTKAKLNAWSDGTDYGCTLSQWAMENSWAHQIVSSRSSRVGYTYIHMLMVAIPRHCCARSDRWFSRWFSGSNECLTWANFASYKHNIIHYCFIKKLIRWYFEISALNSRLGPRANIHPHPLPLNVLN